MSLSRASREWIERNRPLLQYRRWLRRQIRSETELLATLATVHSWIYRRYAELLVELRADKHKNRERRRKRRERYANRRGRTEGRISQPSPQTNGLTSAPSLQAALV